MESDTPRPETIGIRIVPAVRVAAVEITKIDNPILPNPAIVPIAPRAVLAIPIFFPAYDYFFIMSILTYIS